VLPSTEPFSPGLLPPSRGSHMRDFTSAFNKRGTSLRPVKLDSLEAVRNKEMTRTLKAITS
jgi:hypothetical protein